VYTCIVSRRTQVPDRPSACVPLRRGGSDRPLARRVRTAGGRSDVPTACPPEAPRRRGQAERLETTRRGGGRPPHRVDRSAETRAPRRL